LGIGEAYIIKLDPSELPKSYSYFLSFFGLFMTTTSSGGSIDSFLVKQLNLLMGGSLVMKFLNCFTFAVSSSNGLNSGIWKF
jgi:hypothetical protein